jgi:hypothetical protein
MGLLQNKQVQLPLTMIETRMLNLYVTSKKDSTSEVVTRCLQQELDILQQQMDASNSITLVFDSPVINEGDVYVTYVKLPLELVKRLEIYGDYTGQTVRRFAKYLLFRHIGREKH